MRFTLVVRARRGLLSHQPSCKIHNFCSFPLTLNSLRFIPAYVGCETTALLKGQMRQIGYARVSTTGQDYNGQITALKAGGCVKVYKEKISGTRADRPELAKMLKALEPGDVVVVARLDRLARSTRDLLNL